MGDGRSHTYIGILALWIYCAVWAYTKHWDIKTSLASWLAVYCQRIALELASRQQTDLADKVNNTVLAAYVHVHHSSWKIMPSTGTDKCTVVEHMGCGTGILGRKTTN